MLRLVASVLQTFKIIFYAKWDCHDARGVRCDPSERILPGAESCLKNTKQADKPLAHLQTLTLDAVGPITEALEMVNRVKEEEQVELDLEKLL